MNDQLTEQRHQAQHLGIEVLTARSLAVGFEDFEALKIIMIIMIIMIIEAWYRMVSDGMDACISRIDELKTHADLGSDQSGA